MHKTYLWIRNTKTLVTYNHKIITKYLVLTPEWRECGPAGLLERFVCPYTQVEVLLACRPVWDYWGVLIPQVREEYNSRKKKKTKLLLKQQVKNNITSKNNLYLCMVKVNIPECIDIELITGIVCDMGVFFMHRHQPSWL